eukprot:CAMPEP_0115155512 /NCGR_PEP_ID=MMETSP0227-20121206/67931_1 /TAXON_ID=89957 /ORGANISM="Polarella glacialis, Strain CCMP 1383" /LENGTH=100 /DNA_ID=CAMNT_0002566587 /DNA_START=199 /DNA_END=498 /DNA_ORIENTATION=-
MDTQAASEKKDLVKAGCAPFPKAVYTRTIAGELLLAGGQKTPRDVPKSPGETTSCEILSTSIRRSSFSVLPSMTCISFLTVRNACDSSAPQDTGGQRRDE